MLMFLKVTQLMVSKNYFELIDVHRLKDFTLICHINCMIKFNAFTMTHNEMSKKCIMLSTGLTIVSLMFGNPSIMTF